MLDLSKALARSDPFRRRGVGVKLDREVEPHILSDALDSEGFAKAFGDAVVLGFAA